MNITARQKAIKPLAQLYPLPGSKADRKYSILTPGPEHTAIGQPFMGSAARSLGSFLPSYLGDINAAQRSIAMAWRYPAEFCAAYDAARDRVTEGLDLQLLAGYENQRPFKADHPEIFQAIDERWKASQADLFEERNQESIGLAGRYYFALKASFGQVMRLAPNGHKFNSAWHIDKLNSAIKFSPLDWCLAMAATPFDAQIFDCWEKAIEAPPNPATTFLILDPPYGVDTTKSKITACYMDHQISANGQNDTLLNLAIEPLKRAIELGYRDIYLCNYRSEKLEEAIEQLTSNFDVTRHDFGECRSLGNSAGRLSHGNRKDNRERGSEAIWEIRAKPAPEPMPTHGKSAGFPCVEQLESIADSLLDRINQLRAEGVAFGSLSSAGRSGGTGMQTYFYPIGGGVPKYIPVAAVTAMQADVDRGRQVRKLEAKIAAIETARRLFLEN